MNERQTDKSMNPGKGARKRHFRVKVQKKAQVTAVKTNLIHRSKTGCQQHGKPRYCEKTFTAAYHKYTYSVGD